MPDIITLFNRGLDRLLGIRADEVLNPQAPLKLAAAPAQWIKRAADRIAAEAVRPSGEVDYSHLPQSAAFAELQSAVRSLPLYRLQALGDRSQQMAFWINLYNALVIHGVVHYGVRKSVAASPSFFRRAAYCVGGLRFSADDIEHGVLRGNRRHPYLPFPPFGPSDPRRRAVIQPPDPRVHFALVCAARSCPPIAFYRAEALDEQLDLAARSFINGGGAHYDPATNTLHLSRIFRWYQGDFGGRRALRQWLLRYLDDPAVRQALTSGHARWRYIPYDWSLNAAQSD